MGQAVAGAEVVAERAEGVRMDLRVASPAGGDVAQLVRDPG